MKQSIIYLAVCFLIIGCGENSKKTTSEEVSKTQESTTVEASKFGRTNYAVVWNWTTTNSQLVTDNAVEMSEELNGLWEEDIIENVYYNVDSKVEKMGDFPNISFFLKAKSKEDAKKILDGLTVVKKGIAAYTLYPVGHLWLDRKPDADTKKCYVAIWKTSKKPTDALTKSQSDQVLALWNKREIENVYFDIEGTQESNTKTDFVFYVNANSKKEAEAVCNSLPFSKEKIATYKLHEVGVFWMGTYKAN